MNILLAAILSSLTAHAVEIKAGAPKPVVQQILTITLSADSCSSVRGGPAVGRTWGQAICVLNIKNNLPQGGRIIETPQNNVGRFTVYGDDKDITLKSDDLSDNDLKTLILTGNIKFDVLYSGPEIRNYIFRVYIIKSILAVTVITIFSCPWLNDVAWANATGSSSVSDAINSILQWAEERNDNSISGPAVKSGFMFQGHQSDGTNCGIMVTYFGNQGPYSPDSEIVIRIYDENGYGISSALASRQNGETQEVATQYYSSLKNEVNSQVRAENIVFEGGHFGFSSIADNQQFIEFTRKHAYERLTPQSLPDDTIRYQTRVEVLLVVDGSTGKPLRIKENIQSASAFDLASRAPTKPVIQCFFQKSNQS